MLFLSLDTMVAGESTMDAQGFQIKSEDTNSFEFEY